MLQQPHAGFVLPESPSVDKTTRSFPLGLHRCGQLRAEHSGVDFPAEIPISTSSFPASTTRSHGRCDRGRGVGSSRVFHVLCFPPFSFCTKNREKIIFLTRILGWEGFFWPGTEDLVIVVLLSHGGPCSKYEVCWLPLPPSFTYPVHCSSSPCRAPPQPPLEHLHGRSITKFSPKPDLH